MADTPLAEELNAVFSAATAFSSTIRLSVWQRFLAAHTMTGPIAFILDVSPRRGCRAFVQITSNGANIPTFPDFTEHSSSAGWDNHAGVVNFVEFWFDGITAFYRIGGVANQAVPQYAMRLALANAGKLHDIIDNIDADVTNEVTVRWTSGAPVKPTDALATFIQATLAYSNPQMVTLFNAARAAI